MLALFAPYNICFEHFMPCSWSKTQSSNDDPFEHFMPCSWSKTQSNNDNPFEHFMPCSWSKTHSSNDDPIVEFFTYLNLYNQLQVILLSQKLTDDWPYKQFFLKPYTEYAIQYYQDKLTTTITQIINNCLPINIFYNFWSREDGSKAKY